MLLAVSMHAPMVLISCHSNEQQLQNPAPSEGRLRGYDTEALLWTLYQVPARAQSGSFGVQTRAPKLEIKKDSKGMVTVPGATLVEVTSARELLATIEKGQQRRHVSSTQVLYTDFWAGAIFVICPVQ
jgi:hypothetical protein